MKSFSGDYEALITTLGLTSDNPGSDYMKFDLSNWNFHTVNLGPPEEGKKAAADSIDLTTIALLQAAELKGDVVIYPNDYIPNNAAVQKSILHIKKALEALEEADGHYRNIITNLTHRFLTEAVTERGGYDLLAKSLDPMIKLLEKDSKNSKWMSEIASGSLTACINQPVIGMAKLLAWCQVAEVDMVEQSENELRSNSPTKRNAQIKLALEQARKVLALEAIFEVAAFEVAALSKPKERADLQVEIALSLLLKVYPELKNDEANKWLSVPNRVAYAEEAEEFITKDLVFAAETAAKIYLECDLKKVATNIVDRFPSIWQKLFFKEDAAKLDLFFERKLEFIEYFINKASLSREKQEQEEREVAPSEKDGDNYLDLQSCFTSLDKKSPKRLKVILNKLPTEKEGKMSDLLSVAMDKIVITFVDGATTPGNQSPNAVAIDDSSTKPQAVAELGGSSLLVASEPLQSTEPAAPSKPPTVAELMEKFQFSPCSVVAQPVAQRQRFNRGKAGAPPL